MICALRPAISPMPHFFAVEEYDLSYRRFDGSFSKPVNRAAFVSGDAVTVLPYDPLRDRVLLIEQFRIGPMARGDAQPWLLEAIAGRVDPGEIARRGCAARGGGRGGLDAGGDAAGIELLPVTGGQGRISSIPMWRCAICPMAVRALLVWPARPRIFAAIWSASRI